MLNKDDLIEVLSLIGCYVQQEIAGTKGMEWAAEVSSKIKAELLRLNSGPFTLAEAIASGRPLRRRAWVEDGDDQRYFVLATHGAGSAYFKCVSNDGDDEHSIFHDITACDYELQEAAP